MPVPPILLAVYGATQILQAALGALKAQDVVTEEELKAAWDKISKEGSIAVELWKQKDSQ
jgi:hypothetical protein